MADEERTREEIEAENAELRRENTTLKKVRERENNIKQVDAARLQARGDRNSRMLM